MQGFRVLGWGGGLGLSSKTSSSGFRVACGFRFKVPGSWAHFRYGSFRKLGVPYFGILIIRILLFRVLYEGPLFSETPIFMVQDALSQGPCILSLQRV